MAIDNKYGRVTFERGDIGDDEPVMVFRARDKLLPKVLGYYMMLCMKSGSPRKHLNLILETLVIVKTWQKAHEPELRIPASESYQPPVSGSIRFEGGDGT